ncbi:MAG: FtsW/RodA/SpoVE family cell cycle protein, partial [Candidatus Omnitrophota bacterium]
MRKTRVILSLIVLMLIAVGVVMIYSSSCVFAYEKYHDSAYFLKRHIIFLFFGVMAAVFFMSFDY